jgi:hypothetical protein
MNQSKYNFMKFLESKELFRFVSHANPELIYINNQINALNAV